MTTRTSITGTRWWGVVLGERVPTWQEPGAVALCRRLNVKLVRAEWVYGLPGVGPVW
jgi:hypothetical protein